MKFEFMRCGHISNAELEDGTPICGVCYGIIDGADEALNEIVNLAGRDSICKYCGKIEKSDENLPLFQYRPQFKKDLHICVNCAGAGI